MSVYRISTGKLVNNYDSKFRPFFKKGKPEITVPAKPDGLDDSQWFHALQAEVLHRLTNPSSLKQPLALAYVHSLCGKMKERAPEVWTSFGLTIAEAGQEVTPLDLLTVKYDPNVKVELTAPPVKPLSLKGEIGLVVLLWYRYKTDQNIDERYRNYVKAEAKRIFSQHFAELKIGQIVFELLEHLMINEFNVKRLISAVDMWLNRFPSSQYSELRFVTAAARNRHMGALNDYNIVMEVTGLTLDQIKLWIWHEQVADQLDRITDPEEELLLPHSYSHYGIEMGAWYSSPSPYTTQQNVDFHLWSSTVVTLLQRPRALNERLSDTCAYQHLIVLSAACFAFVMSGTPFTGGTNKPPTGKDPKKWLKYANAHIHPFEKHSFPKEMQRFFGEKLRNVQSTDSRSIGAEILKHLK